MSAGRTAAIVVLGILLTLSVAGGNLVVAAQSSVLDADFVTESLDEEDGYEALSEQMRRAVENATSNATGDVGDGAFGDIVDGNPVSDAVTPAYVESQVDPNVEALYAYLHGDSERLNLTLDTRPLAERAGENVAASVRNATIVELVEAAPGDPFEDVPVNATFVERLNEGPEEYDAAKADLRERVRQRVVDAMAEREFERAVANDEYDQLLALVIEDYDPRDYSEAEKRRMVDDRESEIQDALGAEIREERSDEIDDAVDDQFAEFRQNASGMEPDPEQVGNEEIAAAAGDLQMAVLNASTTDQSYDAYRENVTTARADLASAIGDFVTERVDEEAGVVDLNEELDVPREGALDGPRTAVGYANLAGLLLPLFALVLIGGVWFVSRSAVATTATVGASFLVGALPGLVGAPIAGDRLRSMLAMEGEAAATLEPVVQGIVERVVATITGQSLLIAIVGLVLIVLAVALWYGLDERLRELANSE